jgi:hypothetical protein
MDKKINNAVCVLTFSSRAQAEVAQSVLSASGIQSFVTGDDAGGMYPPLVKGIQLFVGKKRNQP